MQGAQRCLDARLQKVIMNIFSDDIIVASKDPKEIYDKIQEVYLMKGVGEL